MLLRSGHPFWLVKNGLLATYPPQTEELSCEVAIIGGGITGALLADRFAESGVDTVVLDRRDIATGSTAASTAMLQYEVDTELIELIEKVGETAAVRSYQLGREAVEWIAERVGQLGDPCDFQLRPSVYLASTRRDAARLKLETECRKKFGFDVEYLDAPALGERYPFAAHGAIVGPGDAEIDAFRFTHALMRSARDRGVRIFDRTDVEDVSTTESGVRIRTDRGKEVRAKAIVFATGYESGAFLKQSHGSLNSTFAAISEPMEPFPTWPDRALVWESARPYFYMRCTPDHRIMIGGEDVPYATAHRQEGLLEKKVKKLIRHFEKILPGVQWETAFSWAGTFGSTPDGLPFVGRPKEWPNAYFALGYGGNGITMSTLAARFIVADYLGRPDPDAHWFRFER